MKVAKVEECSERLKQLLAEQHNTLDARVRKQIQEVIEALEVAAKEESSRARLHVLLAIANLLRGATNIAELISRIGND